MGASIGAAQAALGIHRRRTSDSVDEPPQGDFGGRRVSIAPGEAKGQVRSDEAAGEHESLRSTGITATRSTKGLTQPAATPPGPVVPEGLGAHRDSESYYSSARIRERRNDPRWTDLPWLTPDRNAERQRTNRRFIALERAGALPVPWSGLSSAFDLVSGVELDIRRAEELFKKSRTSAMSNAEWSEMRRIVGLRKAELGLCRNRLSGQLERLFRESEPRPIESWRLAQDLKQRLDDTHKHLRMQPWDIFNRPVQLELPIGWGRSVEVVSRVLPGGVLGARLERGYPPVDAGPDERPFWRHVPDLVHTALIDARGETLYSGLCCGQIDFSAIHGEPIGDAESASRTRKRLVEDQSNFCSPLKRQTGVEDLLNAFLSAGFLDKLAFGWCSSIPMNMARELAVAALVADPQMYRQALHGEPIELRLCAIGLVPEPVDLGTDTIRLPDGPWWGFAALQRSGPQQLVLRDPDGALRTVRANVHVRQFLFPGSYATCEFPQLFSSLRDEWSRLLGDPDSQQLGGKARATADAMRARASKLRRDTDRFDQDNCQGLVRRSMTSRESVKARMVASGLKRKMERLEKTARTLLEAGQQLKGMLRDTYAGISRSPGLPMEMYEEPLSRLALISYLIGETPVLCGWDAVAMGRVDGRVKLLAAIADNQNGHLPRLPWDWPSLICRNEFLGQLAGQCEAAAGQSATRGDRA